MMTMSTKMKKYICDDDSDDPTDDDCDGDHAL